MNIEPNKAERLIEAYLDRLQLQLASLPIEQQRELRLELRSHLHDAMAGATIAGQTADEAVASTLQNFGDATKIGKQLARERRDKKQAVQTKWLTRVCGTLGLVFSLCLVLGVVVTCTPIDLDQPPDVRMHVLFSRALVALTFAGIFDIFLAWRIFKLRRWACALASLPGWSLFYAFYIFDLPREPDLPHALIHEPVLILLQLLVIAPALAMTWTLLFRWRRLEPGW